VERVVLHVRQMLPEWGLAMAKGGRRGSTVSWWLFCVSLCEPEMASHSIACRWRCRVIVYRYD
jgi:hypothetical protein